MGIQDLQIFLENEGVGVDLFRIARTHPGGFRLVLDAEGCLDRLYGGYFSGKMFKHNLKLILHEGNMTSCYYFTVITRIHT